MSKARIGFGLGLGAGIPLTLLAGILVGRLSEKKKRKKEGALMSSRGGRMLSDTSELGDSKQFRHELPHFMRQELSGVHLHEAPEGHE